MPDQNDLFGRDLLFRGDVALDAGGDYIEITGNENLKQSLYHRLQVSPGEYALRPEYGAGLAASVKRRMNRSEIDAIQQRVIAQIAQDDRIQKVIEVVVESFAIGDKPGIRVYVKILVAGQELRLPMTFTER